MRYLIECRPTPLFFGENTDASRNLWATNGLLDLVLFGYSFSAEDRIDDETIRRIIEQVKDDPEISDRLQIEIDRIEISEGSVLILILVSSAIVPGAAPIAGGIGAAGVALWAADKLLGGVLAEFGKRIAGRLLDALPGNGHRKVFSPADQAEHLARQAAKNYACTNVAIVEGGVSDGSRYRYRFKFSGKTCSATGITIWIDPNGQTDPELRVSE